MRTPILANPVPVLVVFVAGVMLEACGPAWVATTPEELANLQAIAQRDQSRGGISPATVERDAAPAATLKPGGDEPPEQSRTGAPTGVRLELGWLEWGDSIRAARGLSPQPEDTSSFRCSTLFLSAGEEGCTMSRGGADFGDGRRLVELFFYRDRFYRWEMPLPPDRFDFIAGAMTKRLGKPKLDRVSTIQNRMGASFNQHEIVWSNSKTTTRLSMRGRGGSVDVGEVVMTFNPIAKELPSPTAETPF